MSGKCQGILNRLKCGNPELTMMHWMKVEMSEFRPCVIFNLIRTNASSLYSRNLYLRFTLLEGHSFFTVKSYCITKLHY